MDGVLGSMKVWAEGVITDLGYGGLVLLMLLDSMNIPIPSEIIMPFGGIVASQGKLNLHGVALAGTLGSVLGSAGTYWIGALFGKEFWLKHGKWVLLRPQEIEAGDRWFARHGLKVTFFGRFIPLVRSFISLPAGIYRAPFVPFLLYTAAGSAIWCYLWAIIGFTLGNQWNRVEPFMEVVEVLVMVGLGLLLVRFIVRRLRKPATGP